MITTTMGEIITYKCEYHDKNKNECNGELTKVDKYEQSGDLVEVYKCKKCGCKTSFIDV